MTSETEPWVCGQCPPRRPAAWCAGCPRETHHHFVGGQLAVRPTDLVIVLDAPPQPKLAEVTKLHTPLQDDAARVALAGLAQVLGESVTYTSLNTQTTYVVLCTEEDPKKDVVTRCSQFLRGGIKSIAAVTGRAPVVVALGLTAAKALGVKATKLKDVQGRFFYEHQIDDVPAPLLCTLSGKMLSTMAGVYNVFIADLRRAVMHADARRRAVDASTVAPPSLEELTRDYVFPETIEDVARICDEIINYTDGDTLPERWFTFFDTETNTKYPHRDRLKILMASFAWNHGKATAIPLFHDETPYDPEEALRHVSRVLACAKPKGAHNLKFDLKVCRKLGIPVVNARWCSMMGEHLLEEDKKGQYGLKLITKIVAPEFADYADRVQEELDKQDGASQLDDIRKRREQRKAKQAAPKVSKKKKALAEDTGFASIPLKDLRRYAAIDADMGRRITLNQMDRMDEEQRRLDARRRELERDGLRRFPIPRRCTVPAPLRHLGTTTVPALINVLADMELHGVPVDREHLRSLDDELEVRIGELGERLHRMVGRTVPLTDSRTIAKILFHEGFTHPETGEHVVYEPLTWTKHGQEQTTEKVLKWITANRQCPFCVDLLIYKKLCKAKSPFVQNVGDLSEEDGRLHTNYNGHGTATTRLSSSDENMQNIPKKLLKLNIKKLFVTTGPELAFVNADAKNAEVRVFSAYSRDEKLIQSINEGLDTHSFFAEAIVRAVRAEAGAREALESLGLDPAREWSYVDFVARDALIKTDPPYGAALARFRDSVKRVVFGILYGAGPKKIAETIGITVEQARLIIDMLFTLYPSIPNYMEQMQWELRTFGMIESYTGHRRRFNIKGAPSMLRARAERQAKNFPIQESSSVIVLDCLARVHEPLRRDLGGHLLLTVHDSLGFQVPKRYLSQLPDFVEKYMVKAVAARFPWLPVAFKWDTQVGPSYGELYSLEDYQAQIKREEEEKLHEQAYSEEEVRSALTDANVA